MAIEKYIDYINDPNDTFEEYARKAKQYNFRCFFVNEERPEEYKFALEYMKGTDVIIASAVDFPEGKMNLDEKLEHFKILAERGIKEIDYVLNQTAVENRDFETIEKELTGIADFCRQNSITDKAIVEMCKLDGDDEAKKHICEIALKARPVFLKTSTGRSFLGAKLEDVKLMKSVLGDKVKIKAAGGIHNYEEAKAFIDAGASALGASAGIKIVEGEKEA